MGLPKSTYILPILFLTGLSGCNDLPRLLLEDVDESTKGGSGGDGSTREPVFGLGGAQNPSEPGEQPTENATCLENGECVFALVDPPPACGDGIVNVEGEACDDGNARPADGCSGRCTVEPFYLCPEEGGACEYTLACGNGVVEPGEVCDDGNDEGDDGCSANCQQVEPGFYCPTEGEDCVPLQSCGDGLKQPGEGCDDANNAAPGCDENCAVEPGYRCLTVGQACEKIPVCGDGNVDTAFGETCDDGPGEPVAGDGCSTICRVEASYYSCPSEGGPCSNNANCGNGVIEDTETCDDGNSVDGDGCTSCAPDDGWVCPKANSKCLPICGDGKIRGAETCDPGSVSVNGCSASCQIVAGYACSGTGASLNCEETVCGDGVVEGNEACDEGSLNGLFYGDGTGCTKFCTQEPNCRNVSGGGCEAACGDGMIMGEEECDDGNLSNNDGCSSTCESEPGFVCDNNTFSDTEPCSYDSSQTCLALPIIYRDFAAANYTSDGIGGTGPDTGHDDFVVTAWYRSNGERNAADGRLCTGMVSATLNSDGKPTLADGTCNSRESIFSAQSFAAWYTDDVAGTAAQYRPVATHYRALELQQVGTGIFEFDSAASGRDPQFASGFYPLEDDVVAPDVKFCTSNYTGSQPVGGNSCDASNRRNYHFTSELRYVFRYSGGEELDFRGDDDVWVYIDGKLVVDLGGIHGPEAGSVSLDDLNLTEGKLYEIVVFQAERQPTGSNYKLTLSGFQVERTENCRDDCGDGEISPLEQCDDGTNNGDYGTCEEVGGQCLLAEFCGDGDVNGEEECDDGINSTTAYNASGCAPGCLNPPSCGDERVDAGEQCDEGAANSDTGRDGCKLDCSLQPFCGDGEVNGEEACDDGVNLGGYGQCAPGCVWGERCGDGVKQDFEACDEGEENGQEGSTCNEFCGAEPFCGDSQIQAPETCDDGINDGSYGSCTLDCRAAPRCGDGVAQPQFGEECDYGDEENQPSNAVSYGGCTTTCKEGPHCGDGIVQTGTTEQCDDGNNKSGDGCSQNCLSETVVPR